MGSPGFGPSYEGERTQESCSTSFIDHTRGGNLGESPATLMPSLLLCGPVKLVRGSQRLRGLLYRAHGVYGGRCLSLSQRLGARVLWDPKMTFASVSMMQGTCCSTALTLPTSIAIHCLSHTKAIDNRS